MSETFKLQYNNNTLTYPGWNGYVCYEKPAGYPITYLSDEHVSVTGDDLYIPGSEGLQLQSSYDPYYRIDYEITNGEIVDGLLVPSGPCTVYAKDKINYFTATGDFEKGSNQSVTGPTPKSNPGWNYSNVAEKYAVHVGHTGDIPASWYETSNRWNPSNASSYSITLNTKMTFTLKYQGSYFGSTAASTAVSMIGSIQNQSQTFSNTTTGTNTKTVNYSKTVTTTAQSTYGVSGRLGAAGVNAGGSRRAGVATYIATGTNGTWTATGIAP